MSTSLGIKLTASHVLGKHSTTEPQYILHIQPTQYTQIANISEEHSKLHWDASLVVSELADRTLSTGSTDTKGLEHRAI